jgi:hypothetical protein
MELEALKNFFLRIAATIIGEQKQQMDEIWCSQYDSKSKRQKFAMETGEIPATQKAHMSKSEIKEIFITSCHIKCTVHFEYIPQA